MPDGTQMYRASFEEWYRIYEVEVQRRIDAVRTFGAVALSRWTAVQLDTSPPVELATKCHYQGA